MYFDVRSFSDYGSLSGQRIDDLLPAADSAADSRKNAAGIKAVYLARMYILDKGALAKPLLEEVALLS